ncbi:CsbD-like [Actinacidiphila alni]|uniref:CsbD-like n=1 Tax=Actinacidiphila alni TaxID=380248 RepID=A0A1I2C8W0_9ACTN|nr:CsbD family protein [Actinacidiphila alni]SFE64233.1 CsbD-like [Actinacidiphila alni]
MSGSDKAEAKTDVAAGKIKEKVGDTVGNERLQAEGRGDQAEGHMREAKEKAKDAVKDVFHRDGDDD